ncbi:MAG: hypothetical protein ACOCWR_08165, partial [Oceanidesulfovibrio sp.]
MKTTLMLMLTLAACPILAQDADPASAAAAAAPAGPSDGQQWTADGESGAALPEMVVEAQNEVRQTIDKG